MSIEINAVVTKELARLISARRKSLKLSQEEVAKSAGVSRSYYSDIERGLRNISVESLVRVSTALTVRPSDILKFAEEATGETSLIDSTDEVGPEGSESHGTALTENTESAPISEPNNGNHNELVPARTEFSVRNEDLEIDPKTFDRNTASNEPSIGTQQEAHNVVI